MKGVVLWGRHSPSSYCGPTWAEPDCWLRTHPAGRLQTSGNSSGPRLWTGCWSCDDDMLLSLCIPRGQTAPHLGLKWIQTIATCTGMWADLTVWCRGWKCSLWTCLFPGTECRLCREWRCCCSGADQCLHHRQSSVPCLETYSFYLFVHWRNI